MINNRQNGRRRGRGGNNNGGGNNNQRQGGGNQGRGDSANRIDSRARGNANQLYEKYKNLARDAQMSGDRVNIEYYLQFADHYFRVLADQRSRMENDNQPRRQQPFDINGDDDDDVNEGEPIRNGEQNGDDRGQSDRGQSDRGQSDRDQSDRGQGDRGQIDRGQNDRERNDRTQGDRQQSDRPQADRQQADRQQNDRQPSYQQGQGNYRRERGDRGEGLQRDARPSANGNAAPKGNVNNGDDRRPRREREDGANRYRPDIQADTPTASEVPDVRADTASEVEAPAPRRRGRPRREDTAAVTTQSETNSDAVIAADRLPPSLGLSASSKAADDAEDAPKPRRRIRRPAADAPAAE